MAMKQPVHRKLPNIAGIEGMTCVVFRRTVTPTNIEGVLGFGCAHRRKWKSTTAIRNLVQRMTVRVICLDNSLTESMLEGNDQAIVICHPICPEFCHPAKPWICAWRNGRARTQCRGKGS